MTDSQIHPDPTGRPTGRPSARRGVLDREQILGAATSYLDRHGPAKLTMRRLGGELGVEAMALYRYVPSRDELLDGVVERVMDELLDAPELAVSPPHWQQYLQQLAHAVRGVALEHPQIFPLVATRPPAAPWLRPPLRSLRWVESFLESLLACEFDDEQAVVVYRAYSTFLLGHLLLEVGSLGADIGLVEATDTEPADLSTYPQLQRLADQLADQRSQQEFEESLESLLDRLAATTGR